MKPPNTSAWGQIGSQRKQAITDAVEQSIRTEVVGKLQEQIQSSVDASVRAQALEQAKREVHKGLQTSIRRELEEEVSKGQPTRKERDLLGGYAHEVERHCRAHADVAYDMATSADRKRFIYRSIWRVWSVLFLAGMVAASIWINIPGQWTPGPGSAGMDWVVAIALPLIVTAFVLGLTHPGKTIEWAKRQIQLGSTLSSDYSLLAEKAEKVRLTDVELIHTKERIRGVVESLHTDQLKLDDNFNPEPKSVRIAKEKIRIEVKPQDHFSTEAEMLDYDERLSEVKRADSI